MSNYIIKAAFKTKITCYQLVPTKEQIEKPIYDYQKLLHDSSLIPEFSNLLNHNFKHKHLG
jgi:hypothetical protein